MTGAGPAQRVWSAADLVAVALLWIVLYLLYASALTTVYYGFDEGWFIRDEQQTPLELARYMLIHRGLFNGRPLSYAVWGFQLGIGSTPAGLQAIRAALFVIATTTACLFYLVLRRRRVPPAWALFLVLFVWSQPVVQIYYAVSLRTTYWLGVGCSVGAFLVLRRLPPGGLWAAAPRLAVAAGLLMVSWTTFQATPFCGLAVLSFYALRCAPDRWPAERRGHLAFIGTLLATMVVYVAAYKVMYELGNPEKTYRLADQVLSSVSSASLPRYVELLQWSNYAGPFEWWNYPWAIPPLSDARYLGLTGATAAAGLVLLLVALWREGAGALGRYATAAGALALTVLPLVADGFSARQNPYIACVPAIVLMLAHAVAVVVQPLWSHPLPRRLLTGVAWAVLVVVAAGAHRGFDHALVAPNARFYEWVVAQVRARATDDFERVLVVTIPSTCPDEPCRGVFGYRASLATRRDLPEFYRGIVREETGRRGVPVTFTDTVRFATDDRAGALVITFDGLVVGAATSR
jgi:hypothetical protein